MFSNFSAASDEQVYAGGSKNFDERTGKYKNDSPTQKPEGKEKRALMREGRKQRAEEKKRGEKQTGPGSGRREVSPAKKETPASKRAQQVALDRIAKLKKKTPASNSPALKARMEKARLERVKKAKMKKPTVRKKK
jgi:hypothetical protein